MHFAHREFFIEFLSKMYIYIISITWYNVYTTAIESGESDGLLSFFQKVRPYILKQKVKGEEL